MLTRTKPSTTNSQSNSPSNNEQLPRFAIGHISLAASDVSSLAEFYERIGMRLVVNMGRMAIVELRGGTHIVISSGGAGNGSLDLMVNDIDETWQVMSAEGSNPTRIERGSPHDRFTATDPEGNVLYVNSSHAIGPV